MNPKKEEKSVDDKQTKVKRKRKVRFDIYVAWPKNTVFYSFVRWQPAKSLHGRLAYLADSNTWHLLADSLS